MMAPAPLFASQNDNVNGFGNFATTYDTFTLSKTWDVESFHFVGGYFKPSVHRHSSRISR